MIEKLRHRIVVQNKTETPDGQGGFSVSWGTRTTIWAEIIPRLGNERVFAMRLDESISHVIMVRALAGASISVSDRINFGSRYFQIKSIIKKDEVSNIMFILAEEGVAT